MMDYGDEDEEGEEEGESDDEEGEFELADNDFSDMYTAPTASKKS